MPIGPYITEFYRRGIGMRPLDREKLDFVAALNADAALLTEAREELKRLDIMADRLGEAHQKRDHESYIRRQALSRMLAQFDANG